MFRNNLFYVWLKSDKPSDLSANFGTTEFQCPCKHDSCKEQRIAVALVDKLQQIRLAANSSIRVHSGYRCRAHQADLAKKGYETAKGISQHELGNAADFSCSALSPLQLRPLAKMHFKAIGTANSFLHVDLRDDKERSWSYSLPTRVS